MADISWIKINVDMFNDEKIRVIENMPEGDTLLVIWVKLLAQAGRTNSNGWIFLNENIPLAPDMLAQIFNRPSQIVQYALATFTKFGMIAIDERDFIRIEKWEKYQNVEGMEKVREQARLRQQKHRQKQQLLLEENNENIEEDSKNAHNVTVTSHNALDIDKDLDIEKEKKKKDSAKTAQQIESDFETFWFEYPRKRDKKKAFTAYKKQRKKYSADEILKGTKSYSSFAKTKDIEYIKYPATFLNNESFAEEHEEPKPKVNVGSHDKRNNVPDEYAGMTEEQIFLIKKMKGEI